MGWSTPDRIGVRGLDLVADLIGKVSLGDVAWLELMGTLPSVEQSILFNAMMVTMVEHGMTPNAIAARMTYLGAPESLNGAVAAGLCGLGSVFAGTMEGAARLLQDSLAGAGAEPDVDAIAARIVVELRSTKTQIPGLGHPLHKPLDPRTPRLFALATEHGKYGNHCRLMEAIAREAGRATGKSLPVNATGAIGAIASELGIDWRLCRGIAVMGRAIGLVGHIAEEIRNPVAREIWDRVEEEASQDVRPK
jgi:citrate synthase